MLIDKVASVGPAHIQNRVRCQQRSTEFGHVFTVITTTCCRRNKRAETGITTALSVLEKHLCSR
jgi:hypothetical protein